MDYEELHRLENLSKHIAILYTNGIITKLESEKMMQRLFDKIAELLSNSKED